MTNRPNPADLPTGLALVERCPSAMWPQVSAFLNVERFATPEARFEAACVLARDANDADDHDAFTAWILVTNHLEELHEVSSD